MLNEKIVLTNDLKQFIRRTREQKGLVLSDLEKKINHSAAWLSQVEGKRIKTIRRNDLIDIFKIVLDKENEEAELYIENYLNESNKENNQNQFEKLLYSMLKDKFPYDNEINICVKNNSITITTIKTLCEL